MLPPAKPALVRTHLDIHDVAALTALAGRLGVSKDRLRKAVLMVGTRISSIESYLRP